MSQFDPFASTPAASSNNNAGGGGQSKSSTTNAAADNNNNGTKNPFDIFGSSSTYTNGNNNNQNSQNGGGGMASLMNPFQQFSTTTQQQQQQQPANANTATSATTSFWQQSNAVIATAMNPSSPSSMWKTLGGVGGATTASSSSLAASSTTSSSTAAAAAGMKYKRVVPYTGPIANLESNWDPWLYNAANSNNNNKSNNSVNMTYLIVKANQSCIVPGGVESVLKWMKLHKHASNNHPNGGGVGGKVVMDDLTMNLESKLSLEECGDQQQQLGDFDATTTANYNMNNNETNGGGGVSTTGGNKKFGKLFKSGLKKAQASITHSVTSIAIKADGGKNPDWVCASLHYNLGGEKSNVMNNNNNNNRGMWNAIGGNGNGGGGVMGDVCLCKTEWIPLPPPTNFGSGDLEEEKGKQISFAVPLCVPDLSFLESSSAGGGDNGIVLTVRLYLRSGATLLKAAAIKMMKGRALYDNQPNRRRIDRDRIRNSSFILLYLVVLYLNKTSTILPFPPHLLLNILTCSGPVV